MHITPPPVMRVYTPRRTPAMIEAIREERERRWFFGKLDNLLSKQDWIDAPAPIEDGNR